MLVVMAIIALLVGLLLPSLKRSMAIASTTVCMHHLHQIDHALRLYRIENDGRLPAVRRSPPVRQARSMRDKRDKDPDENPPWFIQLWPSYISDLTILSCPEDPYRYRMVRAQFTPGVEEEMAEFASYGINSFIMLAGGGKLADLDRNSPTRPADTILVADSGPDAQFAHGEGLGEDGPSRNQSLLTWDDGYDPLKQKPTHPWITIRHGNKINGLTLTGGVREIRTSELLSGRIRPYYDNCAAGGCTLCNVLDVPHYSFARDQLFWWTGPAPVE
jgi:type II secretory pathway pseudopilin PulG